MTRSAGIDDFEFNLIGGEKRPFLGYVSSQDKTIVNEQHLVRGSKNCYKGLTGRIVWRPGLKARGSVDSTSAGVKSSYEWPTSTGNVRPLRVCNGKLQVESDIVTSGTYVWYDLMTGLTLTRFVFDTIWDNTIKKDQLVFVKGDTNLHMWDGGIALFVSYAANVITLDRNAATAGFNSGGGTVTINSVDYTYTGISGSTLTGTQDASAASANQVVVAKVVTTATTPASSFTNDFIKTINNRLHVGSYTSRLIYISSNSAYTTFTVPGTRTQGTPELLTLDSTARGIGVKDGNAHIFAGSSDLYVVVYQEIDVGGTLVEQTNVDHKIIDTLGSALGHEFIDNIGTDLLWLDQNNQLRILGQFRNLTDPVFPNLSLQIKDELQGVSFTNGHLRAVGEEIYITAPAAGVVYWYETRTSISKDGIPVKERLWHPPQVWNISRVAVISGTRYGHSSSNPMVFQMFDTNQWHDDGNTNDSSGIPSPIPYDVVMAMAYSNGGRPQGLINFNRVYVEGYIAQGSPLNLMVNYDYQGNRGKIVKVINSTDDPAPLFGQGYGSSLGDSSLGDNPLGDGLIPEDANAAFPKFKRIKTPTPVDCFEYQLILYSQSVDSRVEVLRLGTNAEESPHQAVFISG